MMVKKVPPRRATHATKRATMGSWPSRHPQQQGPTAAQQSRHPLLSVQRETISSSRLSAARADTADPARTHSQPNEHPLRRASVRRTPPRSPTRARPACARANGQSRSQRRRQPARGRRRRRKRQWPGAQLVRRPAPRRRRRQSAARRCPDCPQRRPARPQSQRASLCALSTSHSEKRGRCRECREA